MTDARFEHGSVYVDTDEGRYQLHIHTDDGEYLIVDIHHGAIEFYENVVSEIGSYAEQANEARAAVSRDIPLPVFRKPVFMKTVIEAGYAPDDPKHPTYHDRMVGDA